MSRFAVDPRPVVAVDWSIRRLDATADGSRVFTLASFDELLAGIDRPAKIVCEATVESWDPARRADLLTTVRTAGHELYVYRPIHTARLRRRLGIEKSDTNDARMIFRIATEGRLHLYPAPDLDLARSSERERLTGDYVRLRLSGGKTRLIEAATSLLGSYRRLPAAHQMTLGNGKHYSPSLIAATAFAAAHASSRGQFERILGLHGSGYPTILRSEVHHHSAQHALRRGVTWREYRRTLRWCYAQLKPSRDVLRAQLG